MRASHQPGGAVQPGHLVVGEPARVVGVVTRAYVVRGDAGCEPAGVVADDVHPAAGSVPLHGSHEVPDLDPQPGLLEHLAGGRLLVALARFHPSAGHRPRPTGRLLAPPHEQQPAVVPDDAADAGDQRFHPATVDP